MSKPFQKRNSKAIVISTINLKGGVGKTALTVALAEFLAIEHNKRVLLIDLDPQTNATVSLIDEDHWKKLNREGKTLAQLFLDKLSPREKPKFNMETSIVKKVSNIRNGIPNLDLLPSSLKLIQIQDYLVLIPAIQDYAFTPFSLLSASIGDTLENYDFVLIDCPPNLGSMTANGLYISDYYLIPCIADYISTFGIPQIVNKIERFKRSTGTEIKPLGIVITMFRSHVTKHRKYRKYLEQKAAEGKFPRVFMTRIPHTTRAEIEALNTDSQSSLRGKYGTLYLHYEHLTDEVLKYVGIRQRY